MKVGKYYNHIIVLNEYYVGPRARKLADLIYAVYGESVYDPGVSEMDIIAAAEIALGERGDLAPKEGTIVPELIVVPERAADLDVFGDWVTGERAIAFVDEKLVPLQAAQPEAVSPLLPTEMLLLARRLAGCLQDWGEYDEDEDSDSEDEEASDEDSDSEEDDEYDPE